MLAHFLKTIGQIGDQLLLDGKIDERTIEKYDSFANLSATLSTENEIKACMDLIVSRDIFVPNGEALVKAVEAKVVVTDTTNYDLVL